MAKWIIDFPDWQKYHNREPKSGRMVWVRMDSNLESNPAYCNLTPFQRYVYDGLWRLRGRIGGPITADAQYIRRALTLKPQTSHNLTTAISRLKHDGLLLLLNQQNAPQVNGNELNGIELKGSEERKTVPSTTTAGKRYVYEGPDEVRRKNNAHWLTLGNGKCRYPGCELPAITTADNARACDKHSWNDVQAEMLGRLDPVTLAFAEIAQESEAV